MRVRWIHRLLHGPSCVVLCHVMSCHVMSRHIRLSRSITTSVITHSSANTRPNHSYNRHKHSTTTIQRCVITMQKRQPRVAGMDAGARDACSYGVCVCLSCTCLCARCERLLFHVFLCSSLPPFVVSESDYLNGILDLGYDTRACHDTTPYTMSNNMLLKHGTTHATSCHHACGVVVK